MGGVLLSNSTREPSNCKPIDSAIPTITGGTEAIGTIQRGSPPLPVVPPSLTAWHRLPGTRSCAAVHFPPTAARTTRDPVWWCEVGVGGAKFVPIPS